MARSLVLFLLLFPILGLAKPARVIIIRHAEKPSESGSMDLSPVGFQRAQALKNLFVIHPEYASLGLPTHIFAGKADPPDYSFRQIETATPLAEEMGLPVETPFHDDQPKDLAGEILKKKYNGQVVMIVWNHSEIPALADHLGHACADSWDSDTFDRVWIMDFHGRKSTCDDLPESVMPGDSH